MTRKNILELEQVIISAGRPDVGLLSAGSLFKREKSLLGASERTRQ